MTKIKEVIAPIIKEESVDLPLFISFYNENGYIIMNFNKRIILNEKNKGYWVDLLNEVVDKSKVKISCALTCRDEMLAKYSLKQLGLLKEKKVVVK